MAPSRNSRAWPGTLDTSAFPSPDTDTVTTTFFISNLDSWASSSQNILHDSLKALQPRPEIVSFSIVTHSVVLRHKRALAVHDIAKTLERAGFSIHSVFQDEPQRHSSSGLRRATLTPYLEVQHPRDRNSVWQKDFDQDVAKWKQKLRKATLVPLKHHFEKKHDEEKSMHNENRVSNTFSSRDESEGRPSFTASDVSPRESMRKKPPEPIITEKYNFYDGPQSSPSQLSSHFVVIDSSADPDVFRATLSITGMTCSSCVSAITSAVEELPWVRSINVNLLTNSATAVYGGKDGIDGVVEAIEDAGFEVAVDKIEDVPHPAQAAQAKQRNITAQAQNTNRWRAVYAVGGMTCSSCVGHVTDAVKAHSWVETVDVNLLSNSATVVFLGKEHLPEIQESIEDAGFDVTLDTVLPGDAINEEILEREISIRIDGMSGGDCPERIQRELSEAFGEKFTFIIENPPLTEKSPILNITYIPAPPIFTIRHIFRKIESLNPNFKASVHHPPTIEDRAREMHAHERRRILFRLILSIVVAIPTFLLGIVFMSLIDSKNPIREYIMEPMWAGNATRVTWALFILATPVYFFAADLFHVKALKEIRAIWRPGSKMPFLKRFYRFGSMNMLMCLGTSIAYFASVVELALAATKQSSGAMTDSYFDSVVFLTMFLLIGRFLEAYSKARTGDAVTSLGKLRPAEAILVDAETDDQKMATDLLEIDDVIRVPNGASPAFDGMIVEGSTKFDESSLTGESRAVQKEVGDLVYSGTVNKGSPIKVKLTTVSGTSMLDQIIQVVREGQTKRAPVERVADAITGHFVPFVVLVAISTWVIWFSLGASGAIPKSWKAEGSGDWSLWSLRFAISVFVIACPCGIGLAAPTALFVGGGLAAKHGILVKGGGEAFQEASSLDCIVFDKTGTLTQGGDPAITDHAFAGPREQSLILAIVRVMEESSNHPIAKALVSFCMNKPTPKATIVNLEEIPGKGLKGTFNIEGEEYTAIIGNEKFMAEHKVPITIHEASLLQTWQGRGESVALIAIAKSSAPRNSTAQGDHKTSRQESQSTLHDNHPSVDGTHKEGDYFNPLWESKTLEVDANDMPSPDLLSKEIYKEIHKAPTPSERKVLVPDHTWELAAIFGIADPLRPEASYVISSLQKSGIDVWMLSGDNSTTANAVGAQVGIPSSNIIAGVLPDQKAEKIKYLQRTLTKSRHTSLFNFSIPFWPKRWRRQSKNTKNKRATIAMVGDGINDAPALSTADLSIAIGSGSDIALSSSSFILINSHLMTLLTLLDLSKVVFRRVYFNFGWALVYNMIAMPIAAGVLYPIKVSGGGGLGGGEEHHNGGTGEKHVRLDPVWASLAMALSSVSVVCSSLALRTRVPGVGFRERKREENGTVDGVA